MKRSPGGNDAEVVWSNSRCEATPVTEAVRKLTFYKDRKGYDSQFIDGLSALPLPGAGKWTDDLIELVDEAKTAEADPFELKYTHFSVKMSRSRSLPLFSACNIDGSQSDRDVERTDVWRRDSRVPARYQFASRRLRE